MTRMILCLMAILINLLCGCLIGEDDKPGDILHAAPKFITKWKTNPPSGVVVSGTNQIKLPLVSSGTYNFTVEWGDGTEDIITAYDQTETTHTYPAEGEYTVTIEGTCEGFGFTKTGVDSGKLIDVVNWGEVKLHNNGAQFYLCGNITKFSASDSPNLEHVTNMSYMFYYANNFNGDMANWDTSNVTNMESMFQGSHSFNGDITSWNTSNVTNMSFMFNYAYVFNRDINSWNTAKVTYMDYMFSHATDFNQNIAGWDVSSVTSMISMFYYAAAFNQDLESWIVSNGTDKLNMFDYSPIYYNHSEPSWYP